jgi:hypothetical protein
MSKFFEHKGLFWLSENLNTTEFNNGDSIEEAITDEEWSLAGFNRKPVWRWHSEDVKKRRLGKIYNYYCLKDPRGVISDELKIPTIQQIQTLLKNDSGEFENQFNLPPSGYITKEGKLSLENFGAYWSSSSDTPKYKKFLLFSDEQKTLTIGSTGHEEGYMVRCVKKSDEEKQIVGWFHGNTKPN